MNSKYLTQPSRYLLSSGKISTRWYPDFKSNVYNIAFSDKYCKHNNLVIEFEVDLLYNSNLESTLSFLMSDRLLMRDLLHYEGSCFSVILLEASNSKMYSVTNKITLFCGRFIVAIEHGRRIFRKWYSVTLSGLSGSTTKPEKEISLSLGIIDFQTQSKNPLLFDLKQRSQNTQINNKGNLVKLVM